jgi:CMP-N-acetylneuraminic acid synthetase
MGENKILCIIPARGGSKRIPKKNIVKLQGKPLVNYTIDAALESNVFNKIVLSTEDVKIKKIALNTGIIVHDRKKELSKDNIGVLQVCNNIIEDFEKKREVFDYICILLPTSPLRTSEDIKQAFEKLKNSDANGIIGVTDYNIPPFWALKEKRGYVYPYFGQRFMVRSQELPEVFVDNGAIYIYKLDVFKKENTWFCSKLISYKMPRIRSVDVDEDFDLKIADFILSNHKKKD